MEPFAQSLATARSRRNVKLFNALMSREARSGKLDRVEAAFDALCSLKPPLAPNEFTYGILLNAYTRSGALDRCDGVLASMRRDGVPVTTVAVTTVIKGHVHALDMASAWAHFDEAEPNIRTVTRCSAAASTSATCPAPSASSRSPRGTASSPTRRRATWRCARRRRPSAQRCCSGRSTRTRRRPAPPRSRRRRRSTPPPPRAQRQVQSRRQGVAPRRRGGGGGAAGGGWAVEGGAGRARCCARVAGIRAFLERPDRDDACREFSAAAVRRYPPVVAGGAAPAERVSWNDGAAPLFAAVRPV